MPQTFTITLTDVNERADGRWPCRRTPWRRTRQTGTVVGTASTTDPDAGDTHTYQLTDTAGGRFAINSGTGEITVADEEPAEL